MKLIGINKETVINAVICSQTVQIKVDEKNNCASFETVNENNQKQHWNVYRHPVDDMMFVVLMGVGNDENDMATWERFNDAAGWCRCAYDFGDIDKYGTDAVEDILEAIEGATDSVLKDLKRQRIVMLLQD